MKKLLMLISCTICGILIYSCHKDTKVVPADYYFKAQKNGTDDWGALGSAYTIPGDSLRLSALKTSGEEHLNVNIKFNGNGDYIITGNQAEFYTTVGLDVVTSRYRLDTTQTNSLTIASYSKETGIISGTFSINFLKISTDPNEYVPAYLNYGRFRVKLPD